MSIWLHIALSSVTPARRAVFLAKQQQRLPDNLLSVTQNIAGTEAIVKVGGADRAWAGSFVSPGIIRIYTEADHVEIFNFFYTPAWQNSNV